MDAYAGKVRSWLDGQLGSTAAPHRGVVRTARPITPKPEIPSTRTTQTVSHTGFCYVIQKKCSYIIDTGSARNIVRESLINELGISYGASKVAWVPFSMPNYADCMRFVAQENPPADLVLGRQWASDVGAVHHCHENQYRFQKDGVNITLNALPPGEVAERQVVENQNRIVLTKPGTEVSPPANRRSPISFLRRCKSKIFRFPRRKKAEASTVESSIAKWCDLVDEQRALFDSIIREAEGEKDDHLIDVASNGNIEAAEGQGESSPAGEGVLPRSARKRNRDQTSQNTDGGDSEGQSESSTGGGKRRKTQQKDVAVQTQGDEDDEDDEDEEEEEVSMGKKLWTFLIT